MIEVAQEDREAAAARVELEISRGNQVGWHLDTPGMIRHKLADKIELTQAFAAHRQQAEDAMKERAAKVCDVYSEVNFEAAGDSVLLDPVLRGKGFSPANVAASDKHQIDGLVYSSQAHAGQHLATAIRGIDTTKA